MNARIRIILLWAVLVLCIVGDLLFGYAFLERNVLLSDGEGNFFFGPPPFTTWDAILLLAAVAVQGVLFSAVLPLIRRL